MKIAYATSTTLRMLMCSLIVASIVAGLIPPPLVSSVLPAPAANVVEEWMPEIPSAQAASFGPYANTTSSAIADNACATPLVVTINVPTNFMINDLNVGFNASHTSRGELRVTLTSPLGTAVQIISSVVDSDDNYDVLLDSSSANPLDNNATDLVGTPYFDRTAASSNSLNAFNGQSAQGNWSLTICDSSNTANTTGGTFNRAELRFDGDALPATTGSSVLTITKSVIGGGTGPFSVSVAGPNNYSATLSMNDAQSRVLNGLTNGIYTVTESSPGTGWTTTYTATTGYSTGSSAVVNLTNSITATTFVETQITGRVFRDFNSDGLITANGVITDTGVQSVTVTAYGMSGASCGSTEAGATGFYTLTTAILTCDGPYRIEFTNLPAGYEPSKAGSQNGTSVQFVNSAVQAANVNFGVHYPNDYCQSNPYLAVSCLKNGSGITNTTAGYLSFPLNSSLTTPAPTAIAQVQQVGSVWGNAFQRETKTLFTSAFVKRHVGFGPTGIGGIYMLNMNTSTGGATLLGSFDLNGVTPSNSGTVINLGTVTRTNVSAISAGAAGDYQLAANPLLPNRDLDGFTKTGTAGYGDIDLSEDGKTLWVVNINQKSLIAVDVSTLAQIPTNGADLSSALVKTYPISGANVPNCGTDNLRPWGLKLYGGRGYIGVICDAMTTRSTANLTGYVLSFDVSNPTSFTQEISIPFTYAREPLSISGPEWTSGTWSTYFAGAATWKPWAITWAQSGPQPIISDIEFDKNGNMVLGITDRNSHQGGNSNYEAVSGSTTTVDVTAAGDILRACKSGSSWVLECNDSDNNTALTPITDDGALSNDSVGGAGEFFYNDYFYNHPNQYLEVFHWEIATGALVYNPLADEIATTVFDPRTVVPRGTGGDELFRSQGVHWYSASNGSKNRAYELVASSPGGDPTTFGKASGLGDLELLCNMAPIEIGNRVWWDQDGDGVQDAGETGISGVVISLQTVSGTVNTTTDINGNYVFTREATTGAYSTTLRPNTNYTITINTIPSGYNLTTPNAQALAGVAVSSNHAISDVRDSDAVLVSNIPTIYYTTGTAGQNNHGLDFGFTKPATGTVQILNTYTPPGTIQVTKQVTTTDGSVQIVAGTFTINIDCGGATVSPSNSGTVAAGSSITFSVASGTVCTVSESTSNLPSAPSGYVWAAHQIIPNQVTVSSGVTSTVIARNTLAPIPTASSILTLTKTISGTGTGPFTVTVNGPSGYLTTTTIDGGQTKVITGLVSGIYTVTETSPGAGWTTTYTATTGYSTVSSAVVTLTSAITATTFAPIQITGTVYRDYNSDGNITANGVVTDTGVQSVTVTIYDNLGNSASTISGASGLYTITPSFNGPYRVEFTNLPSGYEPSRLDTSTKNNSTVQFVNEDTLAARTVNLGIMRPADYCQDNPALCTSMYVNGTADISTPSQALLRFPYSSSGTTPAPTVLATKSQVGSTWGTAYNRTLHILYSAAFLKRHVALGPNGLGAIYQTDLNAGTTNLWLDLTTLGVNVGQASVPSNATRLLGAPTTATTDTLAFDLVGKVGLGDIDISDDGQTLWVVSLNDKTLYAIQVATKSLIGSYSIPDPGCSGGDWRPFALKYDRNGLYVGGLCDAQSSQSASNLRAVVYRFDGTSFANQLDFALNYTRQRSYRDCPAGTGGWYPWTSTITPITTTTASCGGFPTYPTPLFTDIEVDQDGSLILGFADRTGHQMGHHNGSLTSTSANLSYMSAGDILRAYNNNGTFVLESNATSGSYTTGGAGNSGGPGGGEFYYQDYYIGKISGQVIHAETTNGGLARLPGTLDVALSAMDPYTQNLNSGGVNWLNNQTGQVRTGYEIYLSDTTPATFGKSTGIGDLELLCDAAPIEIGNRVWWDQDGDGVQDAGETGMSGVQVSLQTISGTVNTTTDINGNYVFTREATTGAYSTTLRPNTNYTITINTIPSGYNLTTPNAQALAGVAVSSNHAISDVRDSDAVLVSNIPTIYYTTGSAGQNNHGLDFGFTKPATGTVQILNVAPNNFDLGNYVWFDTNNNGITDTAEVGVNGVVVTLQTVTGTITTMTNASGYYSFTNLPAGTYTPTIAAVNFQGGGVLFGYLSSSGYTSTYTTTTNSIDHGIDPASLAAYVSSGVSGSPVTLGSALQPTNEESGAPSTPNGDVANNLTADFGFYTQQVGNSIWVDSNNDGLLNNGELLYTAGPITVTLVDNTTGAVISATTTTTGNYTFTSVLSGTYVVSITVPSGFRSSTPTTNTAGIDGNDNGSASGAFIVSAPFTATPGTNLNTIVSTNGSGTTLNPSIDFGLYAPLVNLGNRVWFDTNNDGLLNDGELGVDNVRVELYSDSDSNGVFTPGVDTFQRFSATVSGGYYTFTALPEGDYVVVISSTNFINSGALFGYQNSSLTEANINNNSDESTGGDNGATVGTLGSGGYVASTAISLTVDSEPSTTIAAGDSNWTVDFGFYTQQVGNQVWEDWNNNGLLESGEPLLANVAVALLDSSGTVISTTTTNSSGYYTFSGVLSGTYVISVTPPAGYASSTPTTNTVGADNNDNGSASGAFIVSVAFTATPGTNLESITANDTTGSTLNPSIDFGLWRPASLGDYVWEDLNHDGQQNDGNTGINGVAVALIDSAGNVVSTTTTFTGGASNIPGYYIFTNLISGTYHLSFTLPVGYAATVADSGVDASDSDGVPNGNAAVTGDYVLNAGQSMATVDQGLWQPLGLGNRVWFDSDNDGLLDGSEVGVAGVLVNLLDTTGQIVTHTVTGLPMTTTTNANGYYTFTELVSGTYQVQIAASNFVAGAPLADYVSSDPTDATPDNNQDNDDNGINPSLVSGYSVDGVVSGPITLRNHDEPINETDPAGSSDNDNWTVDFGFYKLLVGDLVWNDLNNDGDVDSGEPVMSAIPVALLDDAGNVISTTVTDDAGLYTFTNLISGTYVISITPPAGYVSSTPTTADDSGNNSDHGAPNGTAIVSQPFALTPGGIAGTNEALTNATGATSNLNLDFGIWLPLSLGNRVWLDEDSNDPNSPEKNNGLLDASEEGIDGIVVTLLDGSGNPVTNTVTGLPITTTTSNGGYYTFTNLISGTYIVRVSVPSGYVSSDDIGSSADPNNSTDSDDNGVTEGTGYVQSAPITLIAGTEPTDEDDEEVGAIDSNSNLSMDFGLWRPLNLGNQVWFDTDNDGLLDVNEFGVDGVAVELYRDINSNGVFDTGDRFISTTVTADGGYYTFTKLLKTLTSTGAYIVVITSTNFADGAVLDNYVSSDAAGYEAAPDPDNDIDDDDNGSWNNTLGIIASRPITLTEGDEPNRAELDGDSNWTVDFGLYQLTLGDTVWHDTNNNGVQDTGEPGLPSVPVTLTNTSTGAIYTTTTDVNGLYTFTNLISGTYQVSIVAPAGYVSSTPDDLNPDNNENGDDNGIGSNGGVVTSAPFSLTPGDDSGDASVIDTLGSTINPTIDFGLWQPLSLGNRVWYDSNNDGIQNNSEVGVANVKLTLLDASGTPVTSTIDGSPIVATTDALGYYTFTNLISGTYTVLVDGDNFQPGAPLASYVNSDFTEAVADNNVDTQDNGINPALVSNYLVDGVVSGPITISVDNEPTSEEHLGNADDNNNDSNCTVDFGFYKLTLGDLVWNDLNNDGEVDAGEDGLPSVAVALLDKLGNVISTTTTDDAGMYTFTNLISGTYMISVTPPAGYVSSTGQDAGDAINNNDNGAPSGIHVVSQPFALTPGDEPTVNNATGSSVNPTIDFGLWQPASLGDYVWEDLNHDGQQNDGNTGINGVAVALIDSAGNVVSTTTTFTGGASNIPGYYTFTNLISGTYHVSFTLPTGYQGTVANSGSDTTDSDGVASGNVAVTGDYALHAGQSIPTVDQGVWRPASLGDYVWEDLNHDGQQNDGNTGINGVAVALIDSSNSVVSTTTTFTGGPSSIPGYYTFTNLISGTYHVSFTLPVGYQWTVANSSADASDSDGVPIGNAAVTGDYILNAGESIPTVDQGVWQPASLGDYVWEDLNHDGQQNDGDTGLNGVAVALLDSSNNVVSTTTTSTGGTSNIPGYYTFTNLISGTYHVSFTIPSGYQWTIANSDSDASDSDGVASVNVAVTGDYVLNAGDSIPTVDQGVWRPASLGDYVWEDLNHDGQQNDGNTGINGVAVALLDSSNNVVSTTTTFTGGPSNIPGYYTFTNLISGTYHVSFTLPTGYEWTVANSDSDMSDSDGVASDNVAVTGDYVLNAGQSIPTVDQGLWRPLSVGNRVWLDEDLNDPTSPDKNNGIQDVGEAGIPNISVALLDASGNVVTDTVTGLPQIVTTDENGYYTFTGVISGSYKVSVTLPAGYVSSTADAGDPDTDSDDLDDNGIGSGAAVGYVQSALFDVAPNSEPVGEEHLGATDTSSNSNFTIDFGLWRPLNLGNQVWYDLDNNGLFDLGEGGVDNVAIELYRDSNGNGVFDAGDKFVGTTTTANGGYYTFTNLLNSNSLTGTYLVVITNTNFVGSGVLVNYHSSDGTIYETPGVDPDNDVDDDDNGVGNSTLSVIASKPISLTSGGEPMTTTLGGDSNWTVDFGVYNLNVGNTVWEDLNNDGKLDVGEPGIAGVTVTLVSNMGAIISTTVTDGSGLYTFTGLISGTYVVSITAPSDYVSSTGVNQEVDPNSNGEGNDNGLDTPVDDSYVSAPFNLTPGDGGAQKNNVLIDGTTTNPTIDFGLYRPLSLGNVVWNDLNNNGVQDEIEIGVPSVPVTLTNLETGAVLTTTTGPDGSYLFTDLISGTYVVSITAPVGYVSSTPDAGDPDSDVDDQDDNGVGSGGGIIGSDPITLNPTTEPTGENPNNDPTTPDNSSNLTVDFGIWQPLSLGNRVWLDENLGENDSPDKNNGVQDAGEAGVGGVFVALLDSAGNVVTSTIDGLPIVATTDAQGYYTFTNLISGTYKVSVTLPAGYVSSIGAGESATPDDNTDLDDNGIGSGIGIGYVQSGEITLIAGAEPTGEEHLDSSDTSTNTNWTLDFGLWRPVNLGNQVWFDTNNDGQLTFGEAGVDGVSVELYRDTNSNGIFDSGDKFVRSTVTANGGYYTFTRLLPTTGSSSAYIVVLTSTNFSGSGTLVDYRSSDASGYEPASDPDNDVDEDDNGSWNSTLNIISSLPISITAGDEPNGLDLDKDSNWSVDFGVYKLVLGDLVWADFDNDGRRDSNEPGINNVMVTLLDKAGNVISTTVTDGAGLYTFTNLVSGTYVISVTPPAGYVSSSPTELTDGGNNTDHGAPSGIYIVSTPFDLTPASTNETSDYNTGTSVNSNLDFGLLQLLSLGNRVWYDSDNDGTMDASEVGVNGVTLTLLDAIGNPVTSTIDGSPMVATTDAFGYYTFTNLISGTYTVRVDGSNFLPGAPLASYVNSDFTEADADANVDEQDNGINPALVNNYPVDGVVSGAISISVDSEPTTEDHLSVADNNNDSNYTVDFGFYKLLVGDLVWNDLDNDGFKDSSEPVMSNIPVALLDKAGNVISTTVTDGSGLYTFTNLVSGTYVIRITPPVGYISSTPTTTDDSANNTDHGDAGGTFIVSQPFALTPGSEPIVDDATGSTTNSNLDFGLWLPASLGDYVWEDINNDGQQNDGNTGVNGVAVALLDNNGDVISVMTTFTGGPSNIPGYYTFTNLISGTYHVSFTLPTGYLWTVANAGDDRTDSDGVANGNVAVTGNYALYPGESIPTIDQGLWQPLSLGNRVWLDEDSNDPTSSHVNNGILDADEIGVADVLVALLDSNGDPVLHRITGVPLTTTTDAKGYYVFTNLISGSYKVSITLPSGYVSSTGGGESSTPDDDTDLDDNGIGSGLGVGYVQSGAVTLTAGTEPVDEEHHGTTDTSDLNNYTVDFGLWRPLNLGNQVWYDTDNDGLLDAGSEVGVDGVTVELYRDTNGNGVYDNGDQLLLTTTTADGGYYTFTNLLPTEGATGIYLVVLPSGNFNSSGVLAGYRSSDAIGYEVAADPDNDIDNDDNGTRNAMLDVIVSQPISLTPGSEPGLLALEGDSNWTVDFGVYKLSVGDLVWNDYNNNGVKDVNEPGIATVRVALLDQNGNVISITTTAGNGLYTFTGLVSGTYVISITPPAGYVSSSGQDMGDVINNNDNGAPSDNAIVSQPFNLTPGNEPMVDNTTGSSANPTIDFGLWQPLSLGNRVWYDLNDNGIQDNVETGVAGVIVTLLDGAGNPVTSTVTALPLVTTTDANGYYTFTDLISGTYIVRIDGSNFQPDAPLADYLNSDFTESAINDNVDQRDNGINPTNQTEYLSNGVVSEAVILIAGTEPTGEEHQGAMDTSANSNYTVDFGFYQLASLGDRVWEDLNKNGIQDEGEAGFGGVKVELLNSTGTVISSTVTDASGIYTFSNLIPGTYSVQFTAPDSYVLTNPNQGDDTQDSDANRNTGITQPVTLQSGEHNPTLDAGIYTSLSLGNLVWHDANNNGVVDNGEQGIAGVTMQLFKKGDDPTTATPLKTTTTDINGNYLFTDLLLGKYFVYIPTPPVRYPASSTATDMADNSQDNDDNGSQTTFGAPVISPVVDLQPNSEPDSSVDGDGKNGDMTIDFGFFAPASLGDLVWFDSDRDGVQDSLETGVPGSTDARGVAGVLVTLFTSDGTQVATTTTDIHGYYLFGGLLPGDYYVEFAPPNGYKISPTDIVTGTDVYDSDGLRTPVTHLESGEHDPTLDLGLYLDTLPASIGDYVWFDANNNGIQDNGESGIPGVEVTLYKADGMPVATTMTDVNGKYFFAGLIPGDYYVQFSAPAGLTASPTDTGSNDAADSDANPTTGKTVPTTLEPGENDPTWDAGFFSPTPLASIGDYVWYDLDADGIQDAGESGVSGVLVRLYDGEGNLVATTTTNSTGQYGFKNLVPGDYSLEFDPPAAYFISEPNQGSNDGADSDVDLVSGRTAVTTLVAGENDLSWDLGIYVGDVKGVAVLPVSLGDRVWNDMDKDGIQDADEPGIVGVTVKLYDSQGQLIATTVTDSNGNYGFNNLPAGDYYVEFVPPATYLYSPINTGGSDVIDSDMEHGTGRTPITTLTPGTHNPNLDAGFYLPPTAEEETNEPGALKKIYLPVVTR